MVGLRASVPKWFSKRSVELGSKSKETIVAKIVSLDFEPSLTELSLNQIGTTGPKRLCSHWERITIGMDLLEGKKVMTKDGQLHNVSQVLKAKKIIVYFFSASWVNTTELIEKLKQIYEENKKRNKGIEIIYISSDTDEKTFRYDFTEHHGPWTALPFKGYLADELRWMFDITCLPQLVVVKKDGDVITRRGKEELESLGVNVLVTWTEYAQ